MKPKPKTLLAVGLAVLVVAILALAVFESSTYNAPAKPAVTVATIKQRLAKTGRVPTTNSVSRTVTAKQPAKALANSGPGSVIILFMSVSVGGYLAHYCYLRRKLALL